MSNCPRCQQPIKPEAITCPHCYLVLKAHGHPGIPLHRATGEAPLCDTCVYHADDTCNFPHRPMAKECTLYQDISAPKMEVKPQPNQSFQFWFQRNLLWVMLLILLLISFLITLL
ncbi:hypothetical protein NIES2119_07285 [[Phormidium ambiguum] IAM M-71]|uniref:Uncharacterized protein n=1 Tax=[Phormidium ambiguum] IAM M-71 TaxID=454136 RepID=A0A1U7INK5_9CYAN|nr:zinc ribbon domain-containing protein [Phormidium ambiguum]OKH38938.1 hypothetical protein NIES2119_07285 [Phormidium ambiguum IAM M-71]